MEVWPHTGWFVALLPTKARQVIVRSPLAGGGCDGVSPREMHKTRKHTLRHEAGQYQFCHIRIATIQVAIGSLGGGGPCRVRGCYPDSAATPGGGGIRITDAFVVSKHLHKLV